MRILVTAGPTREHIDAVRFISNASSGRMGCAVARAAVHAGDEVTLLLSRSLVASATWDLSADVTVAAFESVSDLKAGLEERMADCDALVMTAAVGDFRPDQACEGKLARANGPVTLRLIPTEDVLASVATERRDAQIIVAFAVEEGADAAIEAKARAEMQAKNADYVVVNTPAAMGAKASRACILSRDDVVLAWADRPKEELAERIVALLRTAGKD